MWKELSSVKVVLMTASYHFTYLPHFFMKTPKSIFIIILSTVSPKKRPSVVFPVTWLWFLRRYLSHTCISQSAIAVSPEGRIGCWVEIKWGFLGTTHRPFLYRSFSHTYLNNHILSIHHYKYRQPHHRCQQYRSHHLDKD